VNDGEWTSTNIHALSGIRTHGLCVQAIKLDQLREPHFRRQQTLKFNKSKYARFWMTDTLLSLYEQL